jgi:peptidase M23-like protein
MQRGVALLIIALLAAALAAAAARAESPGGTTTGTTTTTPAYAPLERSTLPKSCVGAGTAAIHRPERAIRTLGTPAANAGPSASPGASPILTFDASTASGSRCRNESVTLTNVSLFGGAVTATSVQATDGKGTVTGLAIDGTPVTPAAGDTVAVDDWGRLKLGAKAGRLSAPLVLHLLKAHGSAPARTTIFLTFAAARAAAPKTVTQTTTTTPAHVHTHAAKAVVHHAKHHARRWHWKVHGPPQPLKVVPELGFKPKHYVFPVDGGASWGDTYGANRSDIYDGWHHGDDLFAPIGTPLLAVANGTLTLVGWNSIGGWRLWLTDSKGNSFYYAHLSGYSSRILHNRHVRAGQVIAFLGRTGDAFTTTPHLHFEIHPHQLAWLGYDGAVDPTSYLKKWRIVNVPEAKIPQAARLGAPRGTPRQEAAVVWRELLTARHLGADGEPLVGFAETLGRPFPGETRAQDAARRIAAVRTAAATDPDSPASGLGAWPLLVLSLALAASLAGAFFGVRRRRRKALAT